jgi:hypothetical protein
VRRRCVALVLCERSLVEPSEDRGCRFGTRQRLNQLKSDALDVFGVPIKFAAAVKLLGVTFDEILSFDKYLSDVMRSCNYHLRAFRRIRPLLSRDCANMIGAVIVGSKLDYCNSLLYDMSLKNINRL